MTCRNSASRRESSGIEKFGDEDAYAVEFSQANGSRIVWLFGAKSKLMPKVNISPQFPALYRDYKMVEGGVLEPHTVELVPEGKPSGLVFSLQSIKFNTNVSDKVFAVSVGSVTGEHKP